MSAPHTPGPHWAATGEALLVNAIEQKWSMAVVGPEGKSPEGLVAMVFGYSPEGVDRRARLIAAAPELLAVLEAMFVEGSVQVMFAGNPNACDALEAQARAAIAKAKGEQA